MQPVRRAARKSSVGLHVLTKAGTPVAPPARTPPFAFRGGDCYSLDMSQPTRDQFVAQVIEIVSKRFPLMTIVPADEDFAVRIKPKRDRGPGHLASLENLYRTTLLAPQ